jgi:hypothetical protein
MTIRPVGAELLFHADRDRQTDMMKLTFDFPDFAKAPKTICITGTVQSRFESGQSRAQVRLLRKHRPA